MMMLIKRDTDICDRINVMNVNYEYITMILLECEKLLSLFYMETI